jgi:hypothetical protein
MNIEGREDNSLMVRKDGTKFVTRNAHSEMWNQICRKECAIWNVCYRGVNCYRIWQTRPTRVRFEVFTAVTMNNGVLWKCYAVWLLEEPTFRRNLEPSLSG